MESFNLNPPEPKFAPPSEIVSKSKANPYQHNHFDTMVVLFFFLKTL